MANLFSVPSMTIGLMGRRAQPQGNDLSFLEQLMRQSQEGLQADPSPAPQAVSASPQAPAQRDRVSGWRLLDRVLGGDTITGGLDAERARLQSQAEAPAAAAENARLAAIVRTLPEPLQVAFAANRGEAGKALASNYEGYTLGSGGLRGGLNGIVSSAPTYSTVNDTIYANDRGASTPTATAPPGYDDITQRNKAESDARLAALGIGIQQQNANTAQAAAGTTLAPGQVRYDVNGNPVAENTNQTPGQEVAALARQAASAKTSAAQTAQLDTLANTRAGVERARDQIGLLSTGRLAGAIPFNQSRTDLESALDTIKANLSFAELAKMRANSPTGGALGGIAVRELDLLGSTLASLDPNQSQDQLQKSLDIIDSSLKRYEDAIKASQAQGSVGGQIAVNPQTGARVQWNGSAWVPM